MAPDDDRMRERQFTWLNERLEARARELLATMPKDLRTDRRIVEFVVDDCAWAVVEEFEARFAGEPEFRRRFTCDA